MKRALLQLVEELKRLKGAGVEAVPVSEDSLDSLRQRVASLAPAGKMEAGTNGRSPHQSPAVSDRQDPASAPVQPPSVTAPGKLPDLKFDSAPVSSSAAPGGDRPAFRIAPIPPPVPFTLPEGDKRARWEALRELVLNSEVCRAHVREGCRVVFGVGNLDADLFFVGEAPGADEELQGAPFVGPTGQLLTLMIKGMGLEREEVYIGNIMNWRPEMPTPTGNRPPNETEIAFCLPYLLEQIKIIQPKVVVALGLTAAAGLLRLEGKPVMRQVRGTWHEVAGIPCRVTYHPSYILRNGSKSAKRMVWEDLLTVMERAALPISDKQRSYFT